MEVLAMEVARKFSDRSLEISFANAISAVNSGITSGEDQAFVEAALQAQLISYAGLEEIESVTGSIPGSVSEILRSTPAGSQLPSRAANGIASESEALHP